MLERLKEEVCQANLQLVAERLVVYTWGNVSGIDRAGGHVVIKPSGVAYDRMMPRDMVVVSLATGAVVEGELKPSSDTPTHLALYRAFSAIGGVVHTHSLYATAWAQARRELPALGTTHADYFHGAIPCTRIMQPTEVAGDYEANTGGVIVERFASADPMHTPAVLVAGHGPFAWGRSPAQAVHNAAVLEYLAKMAATTLALDPAAAPLPQAMLDKHFFRKHGPGAYYGQARK
jgi:L-ribulose-5-phosphate 4-epimerase